jgi:hypothetical protein
LDVLVCLSAVTPRFLHERGAQPLARALPIIFIFDRVHLHMPSQRSSVALPHGAHRGGNEQLTASAALPLPNLICDPLDTHTVYARTATGVDMIQMPWLDTLINVFATSRETVALEQELRLIIDQLNTDCRPIVFPPASAKLSYVSRSSLIPSV